MPARAHDDRADRGREEARDDGRDGDEVERVGAALAELVRTEHAQGEDRRRVGPDPEEDRLAERDVAGEAGDDVPAARHDREQKREDDDRLVVPVVRDDREDEDRHEERDDRERARVPRREAERRGHSATSSLSFWPMSPCGRTRSTTMITTHGTMVAHFGEM